MQYRYFNLRNLAWKVLIDFEFNTLPIDLNIITNFHKLNIEYKELATPFGYARGYTDGNTIIVNSEANEQQKRFTIAHELGHIYLHDKVNNEIALEKEANSFAARLLMPIGVLNELGIKTPKEIAIFCNVSIEAAEYRFERLEKLRTRNVFKTSELEKKVISNFQKFIEENKIT